MVISALPFFYSMPLLSRPPPLESIKKREVENKKERIPRGPPRPFERSSSPSFSLFLSSATGMIDQGRRLAWVAAVQWAAARGGLFGWVPNVSRIMSRGETLNLSSPSPPSSSEARNPLF